MCVNVKNKTLANELLVSLSTQRKSIWYRLWVDRGTKAYALWSVVFHFTGSKPERKKIYNQALNFWQVYIKNFSTIYLWLVLSFNCQIAKTYSGLPLSEHLNKSLVVQFMYSPYWYWVPFTCLLYVLFCQCQFSHWSVCHKTISHHSLSELCPFCPR